LTRHETWITDDLWGALDELALLSGYTQEELKNQRNIIYANVMTQLALLALKKLKLTPLNKKNQEGFILAYKANYLLGDNVGYDVVADEYLHQNKPDEFLETDKTKWDKETIDDLIDQYYDGQDLKSVLEIRKNLICIKST